MNVNVAKMPLRLFAASLVAILLVATNSVTAKAMTYAGLIDTTQIQAPDVVNFDYLQVSYDPDSQVGSVCMTVFGLEDGQIGLLADASLTIVSPTVNGTFLDSETYSTFGYPDDQGNIVGDLCVTVPAVATHLVDPIAFNSIAVAGTFTTDQVLFADGTSVNANSSIGVIENGFDLSGITGPQDTAISSPVVENDPETATAALCMKLDGLASDTYAYFRNVVITVEADLISGDFPDSETYIMQSIDNSDGTATADVCISLPSEVADVLSSQNFTRVAVSGDIFAPTVTVDVQDDLDTGVSVASNLVAMLDPQSQGTVGCFTVTGLNPQQPVLLTDVVMGVILHGQATYADLGIQRLSVTEDEDGTSFLCVDTSRGQEAENLGDLQTVDEISLSAQVHYASTVSDSFARFMDTKGVTVRHIEVVPTESGAVLEATLQSNVGKPLYFAPSLLKFGNVKLKIANPVWFLPASQDVSMDLGYSSTNFALDQVNAHVTVSLTPTTPSRVRTTNLKLPSGVSVDSFSPTTWTYSAMNPQTYEPAVENKTELCLPLKNSTKRNLTLSLEWTWKVDSKRYSEDGSHFVQLPAQDTSCVSGIEESDPFLVSGDVRFGSVVTTSGIAQTVKSTTVRLSGISKPDDLVLSANPATWRYDPKSNRTQITIMASSDTPQSGDIVINRVKINGVTLAAPAVGVPVPSDTGQIAKWEINLGSIRGDVRAESAVGVSGLLTVTNKTTVDSSQADLMSSGQYLGCFVRPATSWIFSAARNATTVTVGCFNTTAKNHNVDLTGLMMDVTLDGEIVESFFADESIDDITIRRGTSLSKPVVVPIITLPGDLRTGTGQLELFGSALFDGHW